MASKIFYFTKVVAYGILCIITKLEFFQHHFAKSGHRNTSCDPHLHPSHQATNAALPHTKRPPPGGYVQTPRTSRAPGSTLDSARVQKETRARRWFFPSQIAACRRPVHNVLLRAMDPPQRRGELPLAISACSSPDG